MGDLKRVEELDKLIPAAKKEFQAKQREFTEKQKYHQALVNERDEILKSITACNKRRFPNESTAKQKMKDLKNKGVGIGNVYHCERCLGWHLTSKK